MSDTSDDPADDTTDDTAAADTIAWHDAARGLDTHRLGVMLRLCVIGAAVLYGISQLSARGAADGPGGFAMLLAGAEMIAIVIALVGAIQFARRLPTSSATVALAPIGFGVVILINLYALWIVYRIVAYTSAASHATSMWNAPSIGNLIEQAEALPTLQIVAGVGGLLAVTTLLDGIAAAGRALDDRALASRARRTQIMIVVLAIGYGAVVHAMNARHAGEGTLVAVVTLAVYAIVVLVGYLGTLRAAAIAMRALASVLPTATAVHTGD